MTSASQVHKKRRAASARIAHRIPGRVRIRIDRGADETQMTALVKDLQVSPAVSKVTRRGHSLIVEHSEDSRTYTAIGKALTKAFPDFERWSDDVDEYVAKAAADPWINKIIPAGFLGLAVYTGMRNGAVLAGESAFALAYVAFDLYWKFQQENVIHKIEEGLSQHDRSELEQEVA